MAQAHGKHKANATTSEDAPHRDHAIALGRERVKIGLALCRRKAQAKRAQSSVQAFGLARGTPVLPATIVCIPSDLAPLSR